MVNPLARVVMQNVTKTTREKQIKLGNTNINRKKQSLSDLVSEIKGETNTKSIPNEEVVSKKDEQLKRICFSDITKQEGEISTSNIKFENKNTNLNLNKAQSLSELAKNIKGNGIINKADETKSVEKNKRCSFSEIVEKNKKNTGIYKENELVGSYINSKDRNLISDIISGGSKIKEENVNKTTILNLSQAVNSLINK